MLFQKFNATIFDLVSSKKNQGRSKWGQVRRNVGRWNQQVENRQRGLHPKKVSVPENLWNLWAEKFSAPGGYVCKSRQCTVRKICGPVASPPSHSGEQLGMFTGKFQGGLRKPTMETNSRLVSEIEKEPPPAMFDGGSTLGWDVMVAPVSKTAHEKLSSCASAAPMGPVSELSGGGNAPHPLAPPFSDVIREGLQRKQVSPENISLYLSKISVLVG